MNSNNSFNIESIVNCCGCGVCSKVCGKQAITFVYNELGQLVPKVDKKKCIKCNRCRSVCISIQEIAQTESVHCGFIATNKNKPQLKRSSSGGISAAMASKWISEGGYVCGAAVICRKDGILAVQHILTNDINDLPLIQGSKYVQSEIHHVVDEIKEKLVSGIRILFFGTSCQVAGLKMYLGRDYTNLITCDLICHGVIGQGMFNSYINYLEEKKRVIIQKVNFRVKDHKPNYCLSYTGMKDNKPYAETIETNQSGYYRLFLSCGGYRKSCYECKFTNSNKPADITLGDYYEALRDYPELFENNKYNLEEGVSSVLVHSKRGKDFFLSLNDYIEFDEVDVNRIIDSHPNLQRPSIPRNSAKIAVFVYKRFGWAGVEQFYRALDYFMHH